MNCLKPVKIKNPRYLDESYLYRVGEIKTKPDMYMYVPCGKCPLCLSRKREQWCFRLIEELKIASSAYFITLTYNDESLPQDNRVNKRHVQLFLKRFRKEIEPFKIRYFLVSEYGETFGRPHYHFILFDFPHDVYNIREVLKKTWKHCDPFMFDINDSVGTVTPASINYVCKYCLSTINEKDPNKRTFMLCSRRPGIGINYLSSAMVDHLRERLDGRGFNNFHFVPLPRYYKDKVFDDEMKLDLKIQQSISDEQNFKKYLRSHPGSTERDFIRFQAGQQRQRARKIVSRLKNKQQ